jgi:hypothetical protein
MNKKLPDKNKSESGQIIILIVGLILGLIAITAFVVDAGSVYSTRRNLQNAADNASLVAALALCEEEDPEAAAWASAATAGFNNDGITNTIIVSNPPESGPQADDEPDDPDDGDDSEYVEVMITYVDEPFLMQTLSNNALRTEARAVAHCDPTSGVADAQIILDGDDECSLRISGNGSYNVNGGGMHIDSLDNYAVCASGNADLTADTEISIVGDYRQTGNADIDPTPTIGQTVYGDPLEDLEPPNNPNPLGSCTTYSVGGNGSGTINPGWYCSISASANAELTMNPGVYYIDDGNFSISGNADLNASEVMIYITEGEFSISGNGDLDITAPTSGPWQGMMLYMDQANSSTSSNPGIEISGNGSISTTGTIYGHSAAMSVTGNGSNTVLNAQVIVNTMTISGNGTINQNFVAEDVFQGGEGAGTISLAE